MRECVISGIRPSFPSLSQSQGQVTHVLLTRSPLEYPRRSLSARLACVKHAASVRPEPGSNSPMKTFGKSKPRQQTNNFVTKGTTKTSTPSGMPALGQTIKLWHWHIKHPVEFSRNNRTQPEPPPTRARTRNRDNSLTLPPDPQIVKSGEPGPTI